MNEEDVRGKILLPFLVDLGFNESELHLERSFSIRLGKSRRKTGRSDILCRRNGKNLFIIELKNDAVAIDQKDVDQGISYARLLEDNIAPFTIVTNGLVTRVFDSITREELTGSNIFDKSNFWKNDCTLSTDHDLRIRYEALKNFIGFSPDNLRRFCKNQVRERMGSIIGNIDNPYSKFIEKLHVQRQDLQIAFNKFIDSAASVFGLVGSAGVGKTSVMCSLALQRLDDSFVFFYNAAIINKSPLEHIAQDLNIVFSSRSEKETILNKLDGLGQFLNRKVLIFIDAVDEHVDSNLALELSEIALSIRQLERIKICISCKSNIWDSILRKNGTPTHLFEELRKSHGPISKLNDCPGFLLEDFSSDELISILPLYRETFGFKGQISESLLNELKNGFFLRIFSEVYSQREIPKEIKDKELISKYINLSLEKTNLELQVSLRILARIGKIIMDHKYTTIEAFHDEGLEVESLLDEMNFSFGESIPEDLFARNILIKSRNEGSYNVSFYYSKIRDYIICFHSYKLDKLSDNEFYNLLEKFYENHIGQSAISFYIENASENHKQTLIKFKKDKSLKYVTNYNDYLEQHFKIIKIKFDPKTEGDIGIFLPQDLLQGYGYALFPLNSNLKNKVQLENLRGISTDDNIFYQKGVNTIHGSYYSLLIRDQDKSIKHNVFKQLKEILEKGRVSVYNSDILLLEQVSIILYYYYKKLGYNYQVRDFNLPRFELIYPIDLMNLKVRIYKFLVTEYYTREKWYSGQKVESTMITEEVSKAFHANLEIPKLNITGDFPPFEELQKIVDILIGRGYTEIVEHHLPCPDISISETKAFLEREKIFDLRQIRTIQFSEDQAKLYIESFLKHFDSCYKEFIEYCLPTFKEKFPFFKSLPHEYFIYMKDSSVFKWGYLGYRESKNGETKISFRNFSSPNSVFEEEETNVLHGFSLDNILHNSYHNIIKTIDHMNTPKVDEFCVLRNWIYKFLKSDMKEIFKENID